MTTRTSFQQEWKAILSEYETEKTNGFGLLRVVKISPPNTLRVLGNPVFVECPQGVKMSESNTSQNFVPNPVTVRRARAERRLAEKLAADALNVRSVRTASVLAHRSESVAYGTDES